MKTVGYIFNCRTSRIPHYSFDDWVGVYFCDLKEPRRFKSLERAVDYVFEQDLELRSPEPEYLPGEWWWPLGDEDWAEVTYRMARLERAGES